MMDRRIGELCRKGKTIYYCYLRGGMYREHTDANVLADALRRDDMEAK